MLLAGDQLVVTQTDQTGNTSFETHPELAVVVIQAPDTLGDIPPVDISGQLWECGRYAFIAGAIPGAIVEVLIGGIVRGAAPAPDGVARVTMSAPFATGQPVLVRQRAGSVIGPGLRRDVEPLPVVAEEMLPAPVIIGPVRACLSALLVKGVFEGSDVTLSRASGEVESAPFDLSGLWFRLQTPLTIENKWVKVRQDLPSCRRIGQEFSIDVRPPGTPSTPYVYPVCAGSTSLFIDNVEQGAEVHITVGSDEYVTVASSTGNNRFDIDALPAGPITVQTSLCGITSDLVSVTVQDAPAEIGTPAIAGELFKCQRSVTAENLKQGAIVQVWTLLPSGSEGPISPHLVVTSTSMEISVTTLLEGAEVWIVQWSCALARRESNRLPVKPAPPVYDPDFQGNVTRIDKGVTVKGTIRDATVEVLRLTSEEQWQLIGQTIAKGSLTTVPIRGGLAVDQVLSIRQRYCGVQTHGRNHTIVVKPVPLKPILLAPPNKQTIPVATSVDLSWRDGATNSADADRKAEMFDVKVVRGNTIVFQTTQAGTTANIPATQTKDFSATFKWTVAPHNSTGEGPPASSSFTTPAAPDPTLTASQDKDKLKVSGQGYAPGHLVEIKVSTEYSQLVGSPGQEQEYNDNRTGTASLSADSAGAVNSTLSMADVLEPRWEPTGTGGNYQHVKASPYPGATVTITARNKPPIPVGKGSQNWSDKVVLTWSA
ncbi:MAG: hypothetical protein QM705_15940 [Ancrocorticia sp.]